MDTPENINIKHLLIEVFQYQSNSIVQLGLPSKSMEFNFSLREWIGYCHVDESNHEK